MESSRNTIDDFQQQVFESYRNEAKRIVDKAQSCTTPDEKYALYEAAIKILTVEIKSINFKDDDWRNLAIYLNYAGYQCIEHKTRYQYFKKAYQSHGHVPMINFTDVDWRHMAMYHNNAGSCSTAKKYKHLEYAITYFYQIPEEKRTEEDKKHIRWIMLSFEQANLQVNILASIRKKEKAEIEESQEVKSPKKRSFSSSIVALFSRHSFKKKTTADDEERLNPGPPS